MLEVRDKDASTSEVRKQNISSWQEPIITGLNSKAKKRFSKNKSAINAYFTGDKSIEEIAKQYYLSTEQLSKMAKNCLKQHEDGSLWGYRALLPGVLVKDYSTSAAPAQGSITDNAPSSQEPQKQEKSSDDESLENTAKRSAIIAPSVDATETSVESAPAQDTTASETGRIDPVQDQQIESASIPVAEASKLAVPANADQSDDTPSLGTVTTIQDTDREFSAIDANSTSDATDTSVTETTASSDEDETSVAETDDSVNATEVPADEIDSTTHEIPVEHVEDASVENGIVQDMPSLPQMDSSIVDEIDALQQENQLQPEAQEPLIREDNLTAPTVVQVVENPGETETQEPIASPDEQVSQKESVQEDQGKAVAIISDTQVQVQPHARVTVPLVSEEDNFSSPTDTYILPKSVKYDTTTNAHIAQRRRFVRKRWVRDAQDKTKRNRIYRTVSIAMVSVILLSLLLPIGVGLAAYNVYNNVSGLAHDGVNRLMSVKALLPTSKNDIMATLNASKLKQAQNQLKLAETDFIQLQQLAARPDIEAIIEQVAPQYAGKLAMARHLLQVALDVTRMGQELSGVGVIAANIVHSSPLATNSAKPLISTSDVSDIKAAITHALYYMDDIQQNMSQVQMKDLPVSAKQQAQLSAVLTQLPTIRNLIVQNQNMVDLVTWLLGVGQPRHFLVQTMDTGEMRPGGGFTGQYGVLDIENGHVTPFSLHDAGYFDYNSNGMELGRQAPAQYSWMNFGNFGLRDSNLSADYPTTARLNMQVFQEQGGGPVDGVIDFTPTFIGHIIDATGPVHVAQYNETITSSNLEDKLHYYQQDPTKIDEQKQKSHNDSASARKAFTTLLGKLLLSRVSHLPTTKLITLVKNAIKDIQSRDLEIYFTNPAAEQWLVNNGYSGGTSTFSKQDGFMLVQANISISKASEYVHTTEQDNITLDAQGGATHAMAITLDYNRAGRNVYGYNTYSDYMRVYVPPSSQFISGDGFDSGHSLCTPPPLAPVQSGQLTTTTTTPVVSSCDTLPPSETLYCPGGDYSLGVRSYNVSKTADVMGAPTTTTSDLPGRGMFGGMTVTPSDCTSTIMLSWYVPHAVKHSGKNLVYPLLVQKQGGYVPSVQINVDASAIRGMKSFGFKGDIHADRLFNIR